AAAASEIGLGPAWADDRPAALDFGKLEPLAAFLQETPANKLLPALLDKLNGGTDLKALTAAGALANARAFGGHDYDGYHTFMAMAPSFAMAQLLPEKERALPVIKVIHRNSRTMRSGPGRPADRLGHAEPAELKGSQPVGKLLLEASRARRIAEADGIFLAAAKNSLHDAYNDLQPLIQDEMNV